MDIITSYIAAQKMKYFIEDFYSKCYQTRSFLRIWSHLLEKYLKEKVIFCAVYSVIRLDQNKSE